MNEQPMSIVSAMLAECDKLHEERREAKRRRQAELTRTAIESSWEVMRDGVHHP